MSVNWVLYHKACYDGFGAAWAAWRTLGAADTRYEPLGYGDPLPNIPDGRNVFFLDYSRPKAELVALAKRMRQVTVLDHHQTAAEDLAGLAKPAKGDAPVRNLHVVFDNARSGARLAWDHFHPQDGRPPLIDYVEDRDLWRFNLTWSREVSAALRSWPMDFATWNGLTIERLAADGAVILRYQGALVAEMADRAWTALVDGHEVPAANVACCASEVAEELCRRNPGAPFAACYVDEADVRRSWSLRSRGGFDVSAVAKKHGGGGHAAAAGFQSAVPLLDDIVRAG